MEETNNKSVRFNRITAEKFEKVALRLGRGKRLVFLQMVDYFYRSKKDPLDVNDEVLKNTLIKNHKDYIGFIKTQETDLLIPSKLELDRLVSSHKKLLDYFNAHVINQNKEILDKQNFQIKKFSRLDDLMSYILKQYDDKEKLKDKFIYILEAYFKSRESFSLMTSAKEKEQLFNNTINQVKIL